MIVLDEARDNVDSIGDPTLGVVSCFVTVQRGFGLQALHAPLLHFWIALGFDVFRVGLAVRCALPLDRNCKSQWRMNGNQ